MNIKKIFVPTILLTMIPTSIISFSGCSCSSGKQFGKFQFGGQTLTEIATSECTSTEEKQLLEGFSSNDLEDEKTQVINYVKTTYNELNVKTIFPKENELSEKTNTYYVSTTDLTNLLRDGFTPFAQMHVPYTVFCPSLIDKFEAEQKENEHLKYSYHTNANKKAIFQTHYLIDTPSTEIGGIGGQMIADCEYVFNSRGVIEFFQSSLGILVGSASGTSNSGYIFKCEFNWK